MENKILTVSIAAYNVESTIREVLDSLLVPEILDRLEVFVVDDGGTDETLNIAREYEANYPGTFHAVHKENGGYGSTVNWSVAHASGKYIKLLDGDDWYISENLPFFIDLLEQIDADMVFTPYVSCGMRSGESELKPVEAGKCQIGTVAPLADLKVKARNLNMHFVCWKSSVIKGCSRTLTEHCFYTDVEYVLLPLPYANSALIWDKPVYRYRTEVSGQSMSIAGMIKRYEEHEKVLLTLLDVYRQTDANNPAKGLMKIRVSCMLQTDLRIMCLKEYDKRDKTRLKELIAAIRAGAPEILSEAMRTSKLAFALIGTNFAIYPKVHRYCLWKARRSRGGGD